MSPRLRALMIRQALRSGVLAVALSLASPAAGQGGANIGGVVTDLTRGALPGVTVTLVNTNTGATQVMVRGRRQLPRGQPATRPVCNHGRTARLRAEQADAQAARWCRHHARHHAQCGDAHRERDRGRRESPRRGIQGATLVGDRGRPSWPRCPCSTAIFSSRAVDARRGAADRRQQPLRHHEVRRRRRPA